MERHNVNNTGGQAIPAPVLDTSTQLYFGVNRPFDLFAREVIAPRFDGFSYDYVHGFWRGDYEPAARVTIIHPDDVVSNTMIDDIRAIYKEQFKQESVLRVDSRVVSSF